MAVHITKPERKKKSETMFRRKNIRVADRASGSAPLEKVKLKVTPLP